MSLKLWLTVKEFSLLKKICINDEKLVHLYGSIISKFFPSHLAVRGANLFQGTLTIANVKVFFICGILIDIDQLPDDAVERRKLGVNKVRKNHSST